MVSTISLQAAVYSCGGSHQGLIEEEEEGER
jgi:hypothetical protein